MESAEREYLAMAYACTSGSTPYTAKTSTAGAFAEEVVSWVGSGFVITSDMGVLECYLYGCRCAMHCPVEIWGREVSVTQPCRLWCREAFVSFQPGLNHI